MKLFSTFLTALFCVACSPAFSQNFTIFYQTPDALVVCNADTLTVTVTNNTAQPIAAALLDVELPSGLEYLPASVTGASESNISNLTKPVLALPALPPGTPVMVKLQIAATCGLVEAINNGQLFSLLLRVRNGAQAEQVTTSTFIVETGLLVITQVDNDSVGGQKGDMFTRTLHAKNTRLGVIQHLTLSDLHPEGISIQTVGAVTQDDQPAAFNARFDGTFFANFGDGDGLLEFDETILIEEKITVTDCGLPAAFEVNSDLSAAWMCTAVAPPCQGDSVRAEVTVLPFTKLPKLVFEPEYGYAFDHCADRPTLQKIRVSNQGQTAANNVLVQLSSPFSEFMGMDGNSFRLKINGVETPVQPNITVKDTFVICGDIRDSLVMIVIPTVPAQDSLEILFNTYFCGFECDVPTLPLYGTFFHLVECPEGGSVADTFIMAPTDERAEWNGFLQFAIGDCTEDGQVYDFTYVMSSGRLLDDEGFGWLQLELPWGVFWEPSCVPMAAGESPVLIEVDTLVTYDTITRVRFAYDMPLSVDSVLIPFCLRVTCPDDATFTPLAQAPLPDAMGNFTIFNTLCSVCGYRGESNFILTKELADDPDCGIASCSQMTLRTNCECTDTIPAGGSGGGVVGPGDCDQCASSAVVVDHFDAYRLNLGLPDHDDNRSADGGAVDTLKIRRDRFLPGDTMRAVVRTLVVSGDSLCSVGANFFTEVIRSDIPYGGANDAFTVSTARGFFANPEKFRALGATLRIWDASEGVTYECAVDSLTIFYKKLYGVVTPVNVQPQVKIDEFVTMRQGLEFSTDRLAELGCVPDCFALAQGDSVEIKVDFKVDFNYTPFNEVHMPPLINFEMAFAPAFVPFPDFYAYRRFDTLMFQYSGYRDSLTHNTFGIRPCENSLEVKPFYYHIRIARENLFPFEVRPLSRIIDYRFEIPDDLTAAAATLKYLRLQENVPVFQNLPLPFSQDTNLVSLDFSPFYLNPIDEGYKLETNLVFGPACEFRAPDTSYQYIGIDYEGCLHMPDTDYVVLINKLGFFSNQARDTITTDELVLDFPTAEVGTDVLLKNLAPVAGPNYWIELLNPDGGLSGFQLINLPQNTPVASTNGVFQLGTLGILAQKNLRIKALNNSCDPQRLWVVYGWDCQPHLVPGAPSCARDTLKLLFLPQLAELELDLLQFPSDAPLCDTSDYIVFEVFNADLGYAFDPVASVQLPAGMQYLAGSSQIAYPSGSAFQPMADPAGLPNNAYEWNLGAALPAVAAAGLPGVNFDPQNGIQIRFKVVAACGVVSNSQLIFGASAEQICGTPTNFLRKASDPLTVEGLTPGYEVQIGISEPGGGGPFSCSEHRVMSVSLQLSGSPEPGDSVYIALPPGFLIAPFSYVPGANAPAGPPQQSGLVWQLPLPVGLPSNSSVNFSFTVITSSGPNCDGVALTIQTRQQSVAFCPTINANCAVYVATGEVIYSLIPDFPDVALLNPTVEIGPDGSVSYSAELVNQGAKIVYTPVLWFVRDVDGDGQLSAADTLVEVRNYPSLQPGESHSDVWLHPGQMLTDACNLLAVLPGSEICACDDVVVPLPGANVRYATAEICLGESVGLGVAQMADHVYQWSGPGGLPCLDCPNFNWIPTGTGTYELTLLDQTDGCQLIHHFDVLVNATPALLAPDTVVCRGEPVLLYTSPASSWQWQGPGLANPNAPTQLVTPLQTTTYNVTITNAANCSAVADATVTVLSSDSIDLGKVRTCQGTPVDVLGTMTDVPGLYCVTYVKSNGCDSTRCLLLEVTPNTNETLTRCPGDTVMVFGQPVAVAGQFCQTFTSSLGCDSTHCVVVSDLPVPSLNASDTIMLISGASVQLQGPDGFASYSWSPPTGLSCTACQNPVATPPDSITAYVLTVTTADGCMGEWTVYLRFAPPCNPAELKIPNAITPDHDGVNDVFRPAPVESGPVVRRLRVFDRWGNKVYDQTGPLAAWDGNIDGIPAPVDTYVWLLELDCQGELKPIYGEVTVLR